MTINVANLFKSRTAKTFDKSKIGRDVHVGERFPSADFSPCSGKKIFKFGTTTTVVDDNLSNPKPLEHVVCRTIPTSCSHLTLVLQKAVNSSSLLNVCADIHVEKQKKIISKVKSAKNNITKLFKPNSRVPAAVPCIDRFAIPRAEHSTTNDRSSSLSSSTILQRAKPKARVVAACEATPHQHTSLEEIASSIDYAENVINEHIQDLATFFSLAEASSPSSTGRLFTWPESHFSTFPSTFFLGEVHTIEEEDRSTAVVVGAVTTEQKELETSVSYISQSNSDSGITAYLFSDTLSDRTTMHGVGLVSSETSTSPIGTSFATSVDAEDSHQFLPGVLRGLRRVPSCEDLRVSCFKSSGLHLC